MNVVKHKLFRLTCIFILFLFSKTEVSANWNNFIIHYNKEVYGKGSQTWQIASYNNDWVFFANKNGMLQFDGSEWGLYPLNNGADVRSVYPSRTQKRIYVAGINEFGYFSPDERGSLKYTCMSDTLENDKRFIGNIWQILENDNILYFQADGKVLKYLNGNYTVIESNAKIDCSNLINGTMYIGTSNGVQVLIGNSFFPLQGAEVLIGKRIRGIIPHEKGIIIATAYDGLFYWDGNIVKPYLTGVEKFMSQNEIFSIASTKNLIAIGTVHMGLLIIDKTTRKVKYYNENNGLQNNTVLSVSFDARNNLWAGLDNGIDYISLSSLLSNLYSYPYSFGAGYTANLTGDYLYLGTNRGLYYTKYPVHFSDVQPDIHQIPQLSGQVWNLNRIGNDLFCLHDRGVFIIKGETIKRIGNITGVWNCKPFINNPGKALLGMYDGIFVIQKENGEWKPVKKLDGLFDSSENFEQETSNVLWIQNNDRGLIRLEIDTLNYRVTKTSYYGKDKGLPSNKSIYVNKINGKIYFTTSKGIYIYNKSKDLMEECPEMDALLNGAKSYLKLYEYNKHVFSLNESEVNIASLETYKKGGNHLFVSIEHPSIELVKNFERLVPISDSLIIIPNDFGFALLQIPPRQPVKEQKAIHIKSVYLTFPNDSLIYSDNYLAKKYIPKISFSRNDVRFEYDFFSYTKDEDINIRYRLSDQEEWSDYTSSLIKEFSNLHEGKYTFQVEAVFSDGSTSKDSFTFIIRPPWFRTKIAYLVYLLMFFSVLFYIYKWDDKRVSRKKQQVVIEKDKELHIKEKAFEKENQKKEHQIMQLEKEKLEFELQHKSQELANLLINFTRKNEMLTEIKQELYKILNSLKGEGSVQSKQMLVSLNSKIDSNIQTDEVLSRIEEQFDLIHNNFMKHLSEKHPDLSTNERMMCAYLKMNLSSKEIAPLLNISIRGVETLRYRLRKKFNLERDENLTDYLCTKI